MHQQSLGLTAPGGQQWQSVLLHADVLM